jgi:hypothetical protein
MLVGNYWQISARVEGLTCRHMRGVWFSGLKHRKLEPGIGNRTSRWSEKPLPIRGGACEVNWLDVLAQSDSYRSNRSLTDSFRKCAAMKPLLASVFLSLLVSASCHAGTQTGTIKTLLVRSTDGLVSFTLNGPAKEANPPCAAYQYWMIKDETSLSGKQQYAMLLAAQMSGKAVSVSGTETCTRWADGEDVGVITTNT